MKSIVHCQVCNNETIHYKKVEGPWYYKVCEVCENKELLLDDVWEEFEDNRIQ